MSALGHECGLPSAAGAASSINRIIPYQYHFKPCHPAVLVAGVRGSRRRYQLMIHQLKVMSVAIAVSTETVNPVPAALEATYSTWLPVVDSGVM